MRKLSAILFIVTLILAASALHAADADDDSAPVWIHIKEADAQRSIRLDQIVLLRRDPLANQSATIQGLRAGEKELITLGKVKDDAFDRLHRIASQSWIRLGGDAAAREVYANPHTITDVSFSTGVTASGQQATISSNGISLGLVTAQGELAKLKALIGPQ